MDTRIPNAELYWNYPTSWLSGKFRARDGGRALLRAEESSIPGLFAWLVRVRVYSSRKAAMGSMCAALRAGSQLARSAMPVIAAVMVPKTTGSLGLTS